MNVARLKTAAELIDQVNAAGGKFRVEHGALKIAAMPPEMIHAIKAHKPEIVAILTKPLAPNEPPRPITRAALGFMLTTGGGTILGQPTDTPVSLLVDLIERWPHELKTAFDGDRRIYPTESNQ